MSRRASQNAEDSRTWGRWAATADDRIGFHSGRPGTGISGCIFTESRQLKKYSIISYCVILSGVYGVHTGASRRHMSWCYFILIAALEIETELISIFDPWPFSPSYTFVHLHVARSRFTGCKIQSITSLISYYSAAEFSPVTPCCFCGVKWHSV